MTQWNPFRDTIVASPWQTSCVDVETIHADIFEEIVRGMDRVRQMRRSAGLLVHGEAGSGKTHLLNRLRQHLTVTRPPESSRPESLFVWVRLQTGPRSIWRHVRRRFVDDWLRPVPNGSTQFDRVLFHRLAERRPAEGDLERWVEYMLEHHPNDYEALLDQIATDIDLDRNTTVAFKHWAFGRHRRDLRAWLCGDSLPETALERLDLTADDSTDELREEASREVVRMLCRLAGPALPILVSFDQVEALQVAHDDREGLYAFGQVVSTLHDETQNVLLVSCVQSAFAYDLKTKSRGADYDRMISLGERSLEPLDKASAEKLIDARLKAAMSHEAASHDETRDTVPADRHATWPLSPDELLQLLASGSLTPRRLLATCADRFDILVQENLQRGTVDEFLAQEWEKHLSDSRSANTPERSEEIVEHALPLLMNLLAPDWKQRTDDRALCDVCIVFAGPAGQTGVSVCAQANMNSLANRLKRLKTHLAISQLNRLIIVRDPRLPISKTALKTQQYLDDLQSQGVLVLQPSAETIAALDALRVLLSDAKSGDLADGGRTISMETVHDWMRGNIPDELRTIVALVTATDTAQGASEIENAVGDAMAMQT